MTTRYDQIYVRRVPRTSKRTPSHLACQVDPIPASKEGISDSMRERLRREASSGLDADQKQTNILLYIMLGVAALVILGGQGIFY